MADTRACLKAGCFSPVLQPPLFSTPKRPTLAGCTNPITRRVHREPRCSACNELMSARHAPWHNSSTRTCLRVRNVLVSSRAAAPLQRHSQLQSKMVQHRRMHNQPLAPSAAAASPVVQAEVSPSGPAAAAHWRERLEHPPQRLNPAAGWSASAMHMVCSERSRPPETWRACAERAPHKPAHCRDDGCQEGVMYAACLGDAGWCGSGLVANTNPPAGWQRARGHVRRQ